MPGSQLPVVASSPVHRRRRASAPSCLWGAALGLAALAFGAGAQQPTAVVRTSVARQDYTSASAEARQAFLDGLDDLAYIDVARGTSRMARAIALDSTFGLARVLHAAFAPGMDSTARVSAATRGVADAARGSSHELLLAAAIRAQLAGHPADAERLFRAVSDMYPDDALLAMWAAQDWAGTRAPAASVDAYRALVSRFPAYGGSYNGLTYALLAVRDTTGALDAARRQAELAPEQPNPHDTYAEMLQATARLDDAVHHYEESTRLDSTFTEGYVGVAEVRQLQGRVADARVALATALRLATNLPDSLRYMTYLAHNDVYANDTRAAQRGLAAVAQLAEQRQLTAPAMQAHGNLAVVAAMARDQAGVAHHLADARRLAPTGDLYVARTSALAYLTAGMTDSLRAAVAGHDEMHVMRAALAVQERRPDEALRELEAAKSDGMLAQALAAEAHAGMKHADVARAARQQLRGRRLQVYYNGEDLTSAVALRRAGKG